MSLPSGHGAAHLKLVGRPPWASIIRRKSFEAPPLLVLGQAANWPCFEPRLQFPSNSYPSTCWMVQRLTSRSLASSRWLTPIDRSARMYSRCCSATAREAALDPRLRLPRDRALLDRVPPPLTEGEHHRELELARGSRSVEVFRQGLELYSGPVQALNHLQPGGQPVSGSAEVDRVGGRWLTAIIWLSNPASQPLRGHLSRAVFGPASGQLRSGPCG